MRAQQEVVLDGELSLKLNLDGDVLLDLHMDGSADKVIRVTDYVAPVYTGGMEIIPSKETQILQTKNTTVLNNIVIAPIPSNYGLVSWDGVRLTIS